MLNLFIFCDAPSRMWRIFTEDIQIFGFQKESRLSKISDCQRHLNVEFQTSSSKRRIPKRRLFRSDADPEEYPLERSDKLFTHSSTAATLSNIGLDQIGLRTDANGCLAYKQEHLCISIVSNLSSATSASSIRLLSVSFSSSTTRCTMCPNETCLSELPLLSSNDHRVDQLPRRSSFN